MGPDVFNKETGICSVYSLDSSMDTGSAVSLLRYAKGDRVCRIMRLIFNLNHQERTSWENGVLHVAWASFTDCSWQ
ncbi:MAG: hypothetical protein WCB97_10725 [Thiobacillus sp.]